MAGTRQTRSGSRALTTALVVGAALLSVAATPVRAAAGSLPATTNPRPGPDILYQPLATAPQLTNTGVWTAPSILVSGASAYRQGEFLYQDFLYDDHGAAATPDPADPKTAGDAFSRPDGTYTYPTNPAYANNAADLVEFRAKPLATSTAFRVTLNTMTDPTLVAFSVALGGVAGLSHAFPFGANVMAPADVFLTVHPAGASLVGVLTDPITGLPLPGAAPTVTVDTTRHQVEVDVPHSTWDPTGQTKRLAVGVGLWNKNSTAYLLPTGTATATTPGGDPSVTAAAFFNVAFRSNAQEPMPRPSDVVSVATGPAWWREQAQAAALQTGDITPFSASVDFTKLAAATTDDSAIPTTGPFDRILASHFQTAPGADFAVTCFPAATSGGSHCPGQYQGNLQPYAVYVPPAAPPASGYGLTLLLHSLGANYNQYLSSRNQSQFGDRGTGSVVLTTESRGPDGFNDGLAGADVFEAWADLATHYPLNPDWTVITGYSMGGMGTFKLAEQFPDLFAKAQPTVGYSASTSATSVGLIPSLRNIPFLMWNMLTDELVPPASYLPSAQALDAAGYRYELDIYTPGDHLTLAVNGQYAPAAAFLGTDLVNRDPAHVTYAFDPALDYAQYGFVADHGYWLSAVQQRTTSTTSTVDVFSHGFGTGDPTPTATQYGTGMLTGGTIPSIPYFSQAKSWGATPATPVADTLDITATDVSTVTINVARAKVDCNVVLNVVTDGPLTVVLPGCPRGVQYFGGALPPVNAPEAPTAMLLLLPAGALAAATAGLARRRRPR